MIEREPIMDAMLSLRQRRLENIGKLNNNHSGNETFDLEQGLHRLNEIIDSEQCELLSLKDQIIALFDKVREQTTRNSYLLEHKVALTKNMIKRLHPDDSKQSYQKNCDRAKLIPLSEGSLNTDSIFVSQESSFAYCADDDAE